MTSLGTQITDTLRARASRLTKEERVAAFDHGMALIYAGPQLAAKDAQIADLRQVIQDLVNLIAPSIGQNRQVLATFDPVPLVEVLERTRPS